MRTAIIKINCLLILIIFIFMLNSCEQAIKGENKDFTKSQLFEAPISNNSSIADKNVIGNENNMPEVSSNWKIYKYPEYGYEVSYPPDYNPSISGGHSVAANPEFEMRLSLYSKDNQPAVDIDSIKIDTFHNVDNFIKSQYRDEMTPDGSISLNDENHKIYCINGDDYYFVFFSNKSYIFQLSSSSKELLTKIARTFVFI